MPQNIYVIMGLSAFLGLLLLWRGLINFFNSDLHKFRGLLQLISSGILVALAVVLIITSINLSTYKNLTQETVLASIEFEELKHEKNRFIATLTMEDGLPRRYELKGDQWQIDARIIKWHSYATQLGLKPLYQFERVSGRYSNVDLEKTAEHTPNQLLVEKGIDIWKLANKFKKLVPFMDTSYGSATYQVMQNGLKFDVILTQSGLITRPAP